MALRSPRTSTRPLGALKDLFARIDKEHGALHVLHSQVGIPGPAGMDITEQDWDVNIAVNMKSIWVHLRRGTRGAQEAMQGLDHLDSVDVSA